MDKILSDIINCAKNIIEELEIPFTGLVPETSLMQSGLISSMDCLALLLDLEECGYNVQQIDVGTFDTPAELFQLIKTQKT